MEQSKISIRQFEPGDEQAFRALNEEWIRRYFRVEDKDELTFADPQGRIIDEGGYILFAVADGECIGCCALLRMSEGEFEVGKMAVSPDFRRGGIGRMLLRALIDLAREKGATRLFLETNHVLENAIRLYESLGFRHLPAERATASPYARSDVQMELVLRRYLT